MTMMYKKVGINFFIILSVALSNLLSFAEEPSELDSIQLKNGSELQGCVISENDLYVTMETMGGVVVLPVKSIQVTKHSRPGESELLMGTTLLERGNYNRAKKFFKKAATFSFWEDETQAAMNRLQEKLEQEKEEKREDERERIEKLIRRKGLEAGVKELEQMHEEQSEYWGSYRGKLHLLMAQERLDHYDSRGAERHLRLAEKYGIEKDDFIAVRDEIVSMRRETMIHGLEYVKKKREEQKEEQESKPIHDHFLAAVKSAQERGESLPPMKWIGYIEENARVTGLDPLLVWAMIDVESSWRHEVVSHKGAQGLMQLMPMTANDLKVKDPFNPEENIRGGTKYMKFLLKLFDDLNTALAAYNVGPGRVERDGIPPAGKRYIKKVRDRYASLQERFGLTSTLSITSNI